MFNYLLIKNGTIFTHDKTIYNMDLLIESNKIVAMETNLISGDNCPVIDATGLYIIPGLVDMHCELCDPGYDYKEDFESAGQAAIEGGFTSITCNPNTDPVVDNKAIVEFIMSKSKSQCGVNVFPYGSLTKHCEGKLMSEVGEMQIAGAVAISDGDIPIQNSALMRSILKYCSMFDMPVIVHCEDSSLSGCHGINDGFVATQLGLVGAPETAETSMLARNILLAENFGVHLHITHVSSKRAVELIREAKKKGMKITAETSPHYFALEETALLGYNTFCKVNPPLRTYDDVSALIKGIADGTIDIISSDHKPDTIDSKEIEFELASFGISSFETAFSIAYSKLVATKIISLERLVNLMSYKPSQILTIPKGKIALDGVADLVIFDPEAEFIVDSRNFKSKANYSPYDGWTLKGLIKYTIVGGRLYETNKDAQITNAKEENNIQSPLKGSFGINDEDDDY